MEHIIKSKDFRKPKVMEEKRWRKIEFKKERLRLLAYGEWLFMPLINREMFPRLSGQITRLFDGSLAKRRVIMLSQSSSCRFLI